MAAVEPAASGELLSERVAGGILPRVLNSFDMVAIFVAIVLYSLAIGLMLLAGIVHLARGRTAEVDPAAFSAWAPSKPTGLNFTNWTFFGLVILALLGVEVPLNMGVEIRNTRSITRYLFWGSLTVMAA